METIKIENLTIGYGDKTVARNISGSICSGRLTCLLGENGVGKSTLLRTLAGFQPAISGSVTYTAEPGLKPGSGGRKLAKIVSVVLTQKPNVHNITVAEMVGMGRAPYTNFWGTLSAADREIVSRAMQLVGIGSMSHRMVHTLSDGERQKVMIAKALAQQTPVILLDEPTAFLDFPSKVEMMQLLHRLAAEMDKTVFLSTHDLELTLQIADMLWMMNRTRGLTIGTPHQLAAQGVLSEYVERDDISFDKETLTIRVRSPQRLPGQE